MLNLDQVKLLESKVERAVQIIKNLHTEKDSLKKEVAAKDKRISELEELIIAFKDDQSKIEEGIVNALNQLSAFEDASYKQEEKSKTINSEHMLTADDESNSSTQLNMESVAETDTGSSVGTYIDDKPATLNNSISVTDENIVLKETKNDNLKKDLDDVLGSSSDTNKQMDIF